MTLPPPAQPVRDDLLPDHPRAGGVQTFAVLSLVLSLVGLGIVAPFALYQAWRLRSEVARQPGRYRAGGPVQRAWIVSLVATVLGAVMAVVIWNLLTQLGVE